jgi:hypothetical protein
MRENTERASRYPLQPVTPAFAGVTVKRYLLLFSFTFLLSVSALKIAK